MSSLSSTVWLLIQIIKKKGRYETTPERSIIALYHLYSTTLLIDSTRTWAFENSSSTLLRSGALQQQMAWLFSSSIYAFSMQRLLPPEAPMTSFQEAISCSLGILDKVIRYFGMPTSFLIVRRIMIMSRFIYFISVLQIRIAKPRYLILDTRSLILDK